ncbi:MAG: hypothetical protein WD470_09775 [Rhodospirillaceae bacterium]
MLGLIFPEYIWDAKLQAEKALFRIPEFHTPRRRRVTLDFGGRRAIHLGDVGRMVSLDEALDPSQCIHERLREFRVRGVSDDHEQRDPVLHDGIQFIGLVADAAIVCEGNPSPLADRTQPLFIGALGREVVPVFLDGQPRRLQYLGKAGTEVTIREEDNRQTARS